jgi:hypothetical protein
MTIITGKCYWAKVQAPDTVYEPQWSIDICVDDNNREAILKDGLTIKNKGDERGDFIQIRQKVSRRDGTENSPPIILDAQKNPMTKLIGNGSIVNVQYTPFEWSMNGKSGVSPLLKKVQVVNLVPYGEDFDVIEGGYIEGASSITEDEVPF